ncbi:zinc ribbon domain-containing protein, partial [Streptomyces sp. SB3404]|nr:zinc ribbon domain-containing protein [Streptomyces boncukensis]
AQVDALKRAPEESARPYLAVHSTGWGGELVTSLFLRFVRSDTNLYVEAVPTVLCPLQDRYRIIDELFPRPSLSEFVGLLGQSAVSTPFVLLAAPGHAVGGFFPDRGLRERLRKQKRLITQLEVFDYGARNSVRQLASMHEHRRYFQKADSVMVRKSVQQRVLDALVEFAEEHGIDAGELKRSQEVIVNNGIIAAEGAKVESSSVASGTKSRVSAMFQRGPRSTNE